MSSSSHISYQPTYVHKHDAIKIAGKSGWFLYVITQTGLNYCGFFDLAKIHYTAQEKLELLKIYASNLPFEDGKIGVEGEVIIWKKGEPDHKHRRLAQVPAGNHLEYRLTAYPQSLNLLDKTDAEKISTQFPITTVLFKRFNVGEIPTTAFPLVEKAQVLVITGANEMKKTDFLSNALHLETFVMTGAHKLEKISLPEKNNSHVKVNKRIVKKSSKKRGLPQLTTLILTGAHQFRELPLRLLPALKEVTITGAEQFKKVDAVTKSARITDLNLTGLPFFQSVFRFPNTT